MHPYEIAKKLIKKGISFSKTTGGDGKTFSSGYDLDIKNMIKIIEYILNKGKDNE